jgi:hypothetical protein
VGLDLGVWTCSLSSWLSELPSPYLTVVKEAMCALMLMCKKEKKRKTDRETYVMMNARRVFESPESSRGVEWSKTQ